MQFSHGKRGRVKLPHIKFYPRDWLAEYRLRTLSPGDRGVWIDMLCVMAMAEPYGHLAMQGIPMTDSQVASMIGLSEDTYKGYLYRLEHAGVFSRNGNGMIFSRRLIRDHQRIELGRKYGKKGGGNPSLRNSHPKSKEEPRTQNPEPREALKDTYKGDFETFWNEYPKKIGKKAAFVAWQRAKDKPSIDLIISVLRKQSASEQWTKDRGQFIPNPATWLNQGRWDDYISVDKSNTSKMTQSDTIKHLESQQCKANQQ